VVPSQVLEVGLGRVEGCSNMASSPPSVVALTTILKADFENATKIHMPIIEYDQ
jgi:hypothetical protein